MARKRNSTRKNLQTTLNFRTWGGWREGAGRKPNPGRGKVAHRARPRLKSRFPVHITYRMAKDVKSLRNFELCRVLRKAFADANKAGFRICEFSVQGNHLHLICEATDERALSMGLRGFAHRVTRRLNKLLGRKGSVFADRYDCVQLTSPRQVRNALCYVLQNARRHGLHRSQPPGWIDPFSSWRYFDGWVKRPPAGPPPEPGPTPVRAARTWLLREGWQRWGLIGLDEVPAAARP